MDDSASKDQNNVGGDLIYLYIRDLAFDPLAGSPPVEADLQVDQENGYAIVQYELKRGTFVYRAIQKAGGRIYGPIAQCGLLVGGVSISDLEKISGVRFAGVMHPGYKLDASLRARAIEGTPADRIDLAVTLFQNAAATAQEISKLGGTARIFETADGGEVLVVQIPGDQLTALATLADVRHIEPTAVPMDDLDVAPVTVGVRANQGPPWQNVEGLDGADQILGVYDRGVDNGISATLVPDLVNRVTGDTANWTNDDPNVPQVWAGLQYDGITPAPHGTFVTDCAIGNGASSGGLIAGVAFNARAIMRPFNADANGLVPAYLNIGRALTNAFAAGARVHNNSWVPAEGTWPNLRVVLNQYSQQGSATIDGFVTANPTMLVMTSAGNYGAGGPSTIGTLSCSKNSLVVGNSGNGNPPAGNQNAVGLATNLIAPSSSRGPCPGARLKPDVVAPGTKVAMRCMQTGCPGGDAYDGQPDYLYQSGTSFSTPLVSGAALLLRQLVTSGPNRPGATGMLIKALLINGAEQLYNYVPDNSQGWGRINLGSIDDPNVESIYFFDSLSEFDFDFSFVQTGQSVVFENVNFVQGSPLAITLTWYDPPDATLAGVLINDLDLTLTLGNGTVYHGGVNSMVNGETIAAGPADTTNNTEKIILFQTPVGPCTIAVTATRIAPSQRQPFALVVSPVISQGDQPEATAKRQLQMPANESEDPETKKQQVG